MKKWIIIIAVVLVALIVIGVLYDAGYLNFKWSTLSMIFAVTHQRSAEKLMDVYREIVK